MIAKLSQPHIQKFILQHQDDDPAALLLAAAKYPDIPMRQVATQIKARQKAKHKIPAWHETEDIIFPPSISVEQCSSEATARLKSEWVGGDKLIDLTGGAGVDTYFLSRRFGQVYYVEKNHGLALLAEHNFAALKAGNISVHVADAVDFLNSDSFPVDWVYLDPARRDDQNLRVFRLSDCQPDVTAMREIIFRRTDKILIKTSPMLDISQAIKELGSVKTVYVIAAKNEVKEVLYAMQKGFNQSPDIETINLIGTGKNLLAGPEKFCYRSDAEPVAKASFGYPQSYLYEPNAAILKAGAFKTIGNHFNLHKLHPHSHLYTGDKYLENFPGRKFRILAECRLNKREIRTHIPSRKANIATRNFPMSVEAIRKKTGLTSGGKYYIFATTNMDQKLVLLICVKAEG